MRRLFNVVVLMLITSTTISAQKQKKFSKTFDTDKMTTMIINCDDSTISIEPSTDGKVHIDYNFEFEGYSKKEIKKEFEELNVEAVKFENNITLVAKSIKGHHIKYKYNGTGSVFIKKDFFKINSKKQKDSIVRKSKDSLIREINKKPFKSDSSYFKDFKIKEEDGTIKPFRKEDVQIYKSTFIIKIPSYVKLVITGKDASIYLHNNIINELNINIKKGDFSADKIDNNYNKIKLDDVFFKAESIIGGDYVFNNSRNSIIGSVKSVNINSEFSKIEIGEIQKEVRLTDFNSEYWIYNFSKNFKRFDIFSEYSKIHHFNPKTDYSMRAFGHNTINYIGEHKIEMQPNKKGKKFNMMERKRKNEGFYSGHINFDIIHGIIYTYNDTFKINKN